MRSIVGASVRQDAAVTADKGRYVESWSDVKCPQCYAAPGVACQPIYSPTKPLRPGTVHQKRRELARRMRHQWV